MGGNSGAWGGCAAAFDTKRGLYVGVATNFSVWGYSLNDNGWVRFFDAAQGDKDSQVPFANPSLVYDSDNDCLLLWGGGTFVFNMNERAWSKGIPGLSGHPAVAAGAGSVLGLSWTWGAGVLYRLNFGKQAWEAVAVRGDARPPPRGYSQPGQIMVYDLNRRRFVAFSGSPTLNDTWVFDPATNQWTELKPLASPPAHKPRMCYDSGNGLVVMPGWVFDAGRNSWFELSPTEKPPDGTGYIEYDPANKCCIAWNPTSGEVWTLTIAPAGGGASAPAPAVTPAAVPPAPASPWAGTWTRQDARRSYGGHRATAFDDKRGLYVMAGGDFRVLTYSVASGKWEQVADPVKGDGTNLPVRLADPALVYDPASDGLLFTGGGGTAFFDMATRKWRNAGPSSGYFSALSCGGGVTLRLSSGASTDHFFFHRYEPSKGAWEELGVRSYGRRGCALPPGRCYTGDIMVFDPPRKRFLIFSGHPTLNDTWAYDPAKNEWAELKPLASPSARARQGCCYDAGNDLIVIHGGTAIRDGKGIGLTDTWVFDVGRNSWFEVTPAEKPPEGTGYLDHDPANKCCIAWNPKSGEVWTLKIAPAGGNR